MHLFSRHHVFLRCVSVFTALTFLPTSVQAWHFMPAAYAGGGATDSIDLEALLDMEASLRTAAQPAIPNSPLRLVDASPVGAPRSPIPLRPEAQNADQIVSVIPAKAGIQGPGDANPASALDPRMRGDDNLPMPTIPSTPEGVPEFTEGLASKLAQAEGVASNLNLVITPTPLRVNSDSHL